MLYFLNWCEGGGKATRTQYWGEFYALLLSHNKTPELNVINVSHLLHNQQLQSLYNTNELAVHLPLILIKYTLIYKIKDEMSDVTV